MPKYERVYRDFLQEVTDALPGVKWVLCEPFVPAPYNLSVIFVRSIRMQCILRSRYSTVELSSMGGAQKSTRVALWSKSSRRSSVRSL